MDERILFVAHMRNHGAPAPAARILMIQEPLDDTEDTTDCWTFAARYAEGTGADYVEGVCSLPPHPGGRARVAAHAWAEEQTPFGRRVVEFTPGYEQAFDYRGMVIDRSSREYAQAEYDGRRYSVLELAIAVQQGRDR